MQAERGYLITKVFPTLRRYCEEREVSIFELDLRWGISEEEAKQGKVFDICLKEVQRTRPFFIGLLGDRYGWIPTEKERKAMAENTNIFLDYPWIAGELEKGTSITEIEIQEGVLRSQEKINAYFYIRSPKMETSDEFREKKDSHEEKMLLGLKKTIRGQNKYPVKEYDSIEHLGTLLEQDFKSLVDKLFPEASLSSLEKERLQQRAFFKSKTRVYIPNPEWDTKLDEFAESEEKAIVICGENGMGKSALVANWVLKRLEQKNKNEKIIYHFIGISQSEGDYRKITQRLIDEVRDIFALPIAEQEEWIVSAKSEGSEDKKIEELQNLLFSVPVGEILILVLDGIDLLSDTENTKLLNWIPPYPKNVKIIYSTTPNDRSMDAINIRGYNQLNLEVLSLESRNKLVNDYLRSFSKTLTSAQVGRLGADSKSENPLVLLAILDDLRVFGVHEKMDEQINTCLAVTDSESLFVLLLQRIEEVFRDGNAQKNLVKDILSLIAVSRAGLSETEILGLSGATPLYWSQLLNGLAGHLTTMNGLVSFSNSLMLCAVRKHYLSDSAGEYRFRIASFMEIHTSFERKCDELPHQLFELGKWNSLYHFLLNIKVFQYIYEKDEFELGKYWRILRETDSSRYTMEKYFELDNSIEDKGELLSFYEDISDILSNILGDYPLRLKFELKHKDLSEKLYGKGDYKTTSSYNSLGISYFYLGDYYKALECYNKVFEIEEKNIGKKHINTIVTYNNIGACYSKLGDYMKTLEYYNESLVLRINFFGKDHPHTADSYANVGSCYSDLGDFKKALEYYNKALIIKERLLGKDHPHTAITYNNLGNCYFDLGDYQKAFEYLDSALEIREKLLGKTHPDIVASYNNMGNCYFKLADYQKALDYYIKARVIIENFLGKDHPDAAFIYNNLGNCYSDLSYYQMALDCYNEALAIREKLLGRNHPHTALTYNSLGDYYIKLGDYQEALEYFKKAVVITEDLIGKNHHHTALIYNNIGSCYFGLGDFKEALEYYNKALIVCENIFGKYHPDSAGSYDNIGSCYLNLGDYQKALEYLNATLVIKENIFGKNHPDTAISYNNIGICFVKLGDYQKALEYHNNALIIRENSLGKNHPHTASSFDCIGGCYTELGDYQRALEYFSESLVIRESLFGKNHPDTAITYNNLGFCYSSLGDYQRAIEYYNEALVNREEHLGRNHPDTAVSYNRLGDCYTKLDDYQKALVCYNNVLVIIENISGKNNSDTAVTYTNIGNCYSNLGDHQKAFECLNESLIIMENILGKNHPATASACDSMGDFCYSSLGDNQKALKYYNKALSIYNSLEGHEENANNVRQIIDQLAKGG
jgi:tetratricopeptide (TPR) repeat protein